MRSLSSYRHFFFDLDNTLTRSKSPITAEHRALLASFPHDIAVISGAHHVQISKQLRALPAIYMGQNGNHTLTPSGTALWQDTLSESEESAIREHVAKIRPLITHSILDEHDLLDHRGCQISFSVLGHNRPVSDKEACDPTQSLRTALLKTHPLTAAGIEVRIAGTTCLDYFARGKNKGFNVARLIDQYNWRRTECVYIGDALFPGGNDETVIGVIDTIPVSHFEDTYRMLKEVESR